MATLVLTTVGSLVGGPIGGAIGSLIGNQIDSRIFGRGVREGPRLKELAVSTSSYGQPLARHFGRMRVPGTIIWSTELIETSSKEGGGKGRPSTKTYAYSVSFAVALSSTPIARIGRIWADGNLLRGASGDLKVGGEMRSYLGLGDQIPDPLIVADRGDNAPAFRDCAYVVFESLQLSDFGNRIPALTFEIFGPTDTIVSLNQLVPQNASSSGQVTLENARGFSDEGGPIGSTLSAIDRVFPLNCVTTEEGLSVTSENHVLTDALVLPAQLSQDRSEEAEQRHKQRGATMDREPLALRYYDEDRDYQPGVQRANGMRPDGREAMLDLPAAMKADGARTLTNQNAHRARWQNEQLTWRIGELDPRISAGSVVRVPEMPGQWLIRDWEWFDRGIQLTLERIAPQLDALGQGDPGRANPPSDLEATPTILRAFETPPDSSNDSSRPTLYAAVSSENAGWRGASLFAAQGDTLVQIGSTGSRRATIGSLAEPLAGSFSTLLMASHTMTVDLVAPDLAFESTDITGMAMGANKILIGNEVLQFLKATRQSETRWQLQGLLRGRGGTEDAAIVGHDSGSPVVLLDDSLVALDPAQVPAESDVRIAAIGLADAEPVYAPLSNPGLSRRPAMPVAPRGTVYPNGSLQFCWTRRARGYWRWSDALEVPLVEETEEYLVGYGPIETPAMMWRMSEPTFLLAAADKMELVAQHGPANLWVRQIGTFGPSAALHLAYIS